MKFVNKLEPDANKPLIIAAMQDMGNVGSIVVNFINKGLNTTPFRFAKSNRPPYVFDKGGYIEVPEEHWEYRYGHDIIVFGGGRGQPEQGDELNELCQDVINTAKKYDAKFIYTVGDSILVDSLANIQQHMLQLQLKSYLSKYVILV